jgi:hypothetical protein
MAISRDSNRAKILILALSSALTLTAGTAIGRDKPPQALSDAIASEVKQQSTLQGILFLGPVEYVSSDSRRLQVLGHKLRKRSPEPTLLPAQYVAVFGEISNSGSIRVSRIHVLDDVYVPGISPVIAAGTLLSSGNGTQFGSVGQAQINALAFAEFGEWSRAHSRKLSLVIGTQPIAGAAIDVSAIAAFERDTEVVLDISRTQDRGIDGSGVSVSTRGIDGSGVTSLGRGIDGSGAATKGIDGSGAATRGIDGSGAATRGIDGSGAATKGIDGSGAATKGIDGSGAATKGIDGSGAATRGIDGSGAVTKGIDGSGSQTELEVAKPPGGI